MQKCKETRLEIMHLPASFNSEEGGHVHMRAEYFKNISHEPIGYSTKIGTERVEWGRLNIRIVLCTSFEVIL